jgi:hypothetical protein
VSARSARTLWPDRPAIGQALWLPDVDNVEWREVIGVVEDIQFHSDGEPPALHVFVPWTQAASGRPRLLVKGTSDGACIARRVTPLPPSLKLRRTSRATAWRAQSKNRTADRGQRTAN